MGDSEPDNAGVHKDVERTGGEGEAASQAAPDIGDESASGQTQVDAPPDDVGVPPDDEMNEPG